LKFDKIYFGNYFSKCKGGDGVDFNIEYESEEKRKERRHRRKVIADWKAAAKALRESGDGNKIMLLREARQESLRIIEDAARTEDDFKNVMHIWDVMAIIEHWRLDKQECKIMDALPDNPDYLDYEVTENQTIIPKPLNHEYWRQLLGGNFLDVIHDCPHELHEFTSSRAVIEYMKELDESHKEILYYWAIRYWSPQRIAALRGQTDRNIRKVYNNMIGDIRRKLYIRLFFRYIEKLPLTNAQRKFMDNYWEQLGEIQQNKLKKKIEKEKQRRKKALKDRKCNSESNGSENIILDFDNDEC